MKADVAIIGAGPAGSIAAQRLAAAGAQVILIEQGNFPRDKTCGDGVTSQGLEVLDRSGLGDWVSGFPTMKLLRLTSPEGVALDIDLEKGTNGNVGRLIPRSLLDYRLVKEALKAGAKLLEKTKIEAIDLNTSGAATVKGPGLEIEAPLVILAEGSQASLAKHLGLAQGNPELLAVRQYFGGDRGPGERLEIHFQRGIMPGYNWLFPVGDGYANVGSGTYSRRVMGKEIDLRQEINRFKEDPILEGRLSRSEPASQLRGAPLRTQLASAHLCVNNLLVAGDTAGLVNPFNGVGIGQAMISGELAAAQALAALKTGRFTRKDLAGYSHAIKQYYSADQRAARFIRSILSNPGLLNAAFKRLRHRPDLALLLGQVILAKKSPTRLLRPAVLGGLLFG